MKSDSPNLRVFLDEGVPVNAGNPFKSAGYEVIYHGDALFPSASDQAVATAAILNEAILIAVDRDMKQMAKRFGNTDRKGKYARLNLVFVACNGPMATKRLEQSLSFIEHEWAISCQKAARTLWVEIGPHYFKTHR